MPRGDGPIAVFLARFVAVGAVVGFLLAGGALGLNADPSGHATRGEPAPVFAASASEDDNKSPLLMGSVSTGIVVVDDALRGFVTSDLDTAFAQLVVPEVPCGVLPWGGVPVLACAKGVAPGAVYRMILAGCDPAWLPPEAARAEITGLLAVTPGVYSVARSGPYYVAALAWPDAPERSLVLAISSPGITSYAFGCGAPSAAKPGNALKFVAGESR